MKKKLLSNVKIIVRGHGAQYQAFKDEWISTICYPEPGTQYYGNGCYIAYSVNAPHTGNNLIDVRYDKRNMLTIIFEHLHEYYGLDTTTVTSCSLKYKYKVVKS